MMQTEYSWEIGSLRDDKRVVAEMNYQGPPESPRQKIGRYINHTPEIENHSDVHVALPVAVVDGRDNKELRLDTTGFELIRLADEVDYETVIRRGLEASGRKVLGVCCFDETRRHSRQGNSLNATSSTDFAKPVSRVHCDYTKESGPRRLEQLASRDQRIASLKQRAKQYAFINLWRSLDKNHPVQEWPLALLDPRSVPFDDRVLVYELVFSDRIGLNYSLKPHSVGHNWFFFPEMTHQEAILFSVFDSDFSNRPTFVFHSAFDLPPSRSEQSYDEKTEPQLPDQTNPRISIEVRAIAFFDD